MLFDCSWGEEELEVSLFPQVLMKLAQRTWLEKC